MEYYWVAIGFIGQTMFTARFVIQWLASERARESVIPTLFWYFSLAGSMLLLSYAIFRRDPVFILGQSCGFIVYLRNLYFIKLRRQPPASST